MKYPITFSLVTSLLLVACAAAPSQGARRISSSGPVITNPRSQPPRWPVEVALVGGDRRTDVEPYRPAIVLLPKDKGPKDYQSYVEREFRRDANAPYQGIRRDKPW